MPIVSRPATDAYRDNFDETFGKKPDKPEPVFEPIEETLRAVPGSAESPESAGPADFVDPNLILRVDGK